MADLVSVIIPCFNGEAFVEDAIRSALQQTHAAKEVVVVNDGSTDGSLRVMSGFADRIKIVDQPNCGLSAARNRGIAESRGHWLAFLDADDWWDPRFLERSMEALRAGAVLSYCGWQNVGLSGLRGEPFIPLDYESSPTKLAAIVEGPKWPVHAALVRRDVVEQAGRFDESLPCCEDFALWIRIATRAPIVRVAEVLAYYRFHPGQMTRNRAKLARTHYRVQREYLQEHPEAVAALGRPTLERITVGSLLYRGYEAYWAGDLATARPIFRAVMRSGYGSPGDWLHMLPSLLPQALHRVLVRCRSKLRPDHRAERE